ncbi:MAG: aspartyl protease family protein [Bacteroidales bacterium]
MAKSTLPVYHVKEDRGIHQWVNIYLNGLPARMVIDTGASHTVFCNRRIRHYIGEGAIEDPGFQALGMGEDLTVYSLRVQDFKVNKILLPHYDVLLADLSMIEQLYQPLIQGPLHGVLGGDLLTLPDTRLSFPRNLLRLGGMRAVRFKPLSLLPGTVHLLVQLKVQGQTANMFIDTGASVTLFNLKHFHTICHFDENQIIPEPEACKGIKDNNSYFGTAYLQELSIGHVVMHDFPARLIDLDHVNGAYMKLGYPPLDGLLGNDLLYQLQAELLITDKRMIIRD